MMEVITLPKKFYGQTHAQMEHYHVQGTVLHIEGVYGKNLASGFVHAVGLAPYTYVLVDDIWDDFQIQTTLRGRPATKPQHDFQGSDVKAWLEDEPAALERVKLVVEARRLRLEEEAAEAEEARVAAEES